MRLVTESRPLPILSVTGGEAVRPRTPTGAPWPRQIRGDRVAPVCRDGRNPYLEAFGVPSDQLFSAIYR